MVQMRVLILLAIQLLLLQPAFADFKLDANKELTATIIGEPSPVVLTAFDIFSTDYQRVFNARVNRAAKGSLVVGIIADISGAEKIVSAQEMINLKSDVQAFLLKVKGDQLYIFGSDAHGLAYGILELSRQMGVSPWEWWADVPVARKDKLVLKEGYSLYNHPSVKYRGIFLNDEDWGLQPWAAKTFEPETNDIGPKTYAKIFELLLRLRANLIWPAMHPSTKAFFHYPGNIKMAEKYGIYIGSSHAEPMLRNNVDEWNEKEMGRFNYVTNKAQIYKYWENRVKQTRSINGMYTLGIRGVHDSKMEGANTVAEQKQVLDTVLADQRSLLKKYINVDVTKVPQVFIPYKEVQDIYDYGINLPQEVSLIWCDDNFGYIRHFPNEAERKRKGGNGIYYHISYWGRPHDYLWLATTHPAQIYGQMKLAYDKGARDLWIVNVGDIKPGEYLTELFLDMAWNIDSIANNIAALEKHLNDFIESKFGNAVAQQMLPVMREYYRLAYIRKPEFMGGTRTEESDPKFKQIADLPFTESEIRQRLKDYNAIAAKVSLINKMIKPEAYSAWFQLFEYPVLAATEMNRKQLYGQLARHGKADWRLSDDANEHITKLTEEYNALNNGKWKWMMDAKPRKLAVFDKVPRTEVNVPMMTEDTPLVFFNGNQYKTFNGVQPVALGLGYEGGAVTLAKRTSVVYEFDGDKNAVNVQLALAPNHPLEGKSIRYTIQLDDEAPLTVDYATAGRSEEWKLNVLSNQAIRTTKHQLKKGIVHTVKITAMDEGVIIDQMKIW